ncbi:MAG TPA: trimeric intracellular cation channel family protein [Candidatus Lachnoclostridium stercorigallinarum]|uniref:Trimeric intracellular cation channel family protein n=1 Tax=Candidatus Lachnoclostridium stercorigallinarum TaxID=2838634 RepID=A0A9D2GKB0_9FIRM|nr:trimeric intracellular cation channel family protein [Candidatus Lachnoclostridium stercorigallinarum]
MIHEISVFLVVELVGTVAFACSGAMVAIEKRLDLLGVIVLGVITAVGGGMIRDILIGTRPPSLFLNPVYVATALIAVLILFFIMKFSRRCQDLLYSETYEGMMNFMDAIGLGVFTVVGMDTAINAGYGEYRFLMVFLGVITGVGGGILRDIMAVQTPYVLKKHIYACASLAGALCYMILLPRMERDGAVVISACLVVTIRVLARKYRWNLPRIEIRDRE